MQTEKEIKLLFYLFSFFFQSPVRSILSKVSSLKYHRHLSSASLILLCYTVLYYTTLYYTILHYTILCYTIQYDTILYYTILYYTTLHYTILYYAML